MQKLTKALEVLAAVVRWLPVTVRVSKNSFLFVFKRCHLYLTSEFNAVVSIAQGLGRAYIDRTFTGAQEQFWPDALPATTNNST